MSLYYDQRTANIKSSNNVSTTVYATPTSPTFTVKLGSGADVVTPYDQWIVNRWNTGIIKEDNMTKPLTNTDPATVEKMKNEFANYVKYGDCFNDVMIKLTRMQVTTAYNSSIQGIKVYVPDKVMGVWIAGKEYKQVVKEPDIFSMEFGCALALAKHMYGSMLTSRGIELAAENLLYLKPVVKEIKTAIRMYKDMEKAKAKEAAREEEIKAIKARRREKNRLRREKRKQKR